MLECVNYLIMSETKVKTKNVVILGAAFGLIFTGFLTIAATAETILRSYQRRTGADNLNGFLSQGLGYVSTALTVPFIPAVMSKIGRRWTMFLGGAAYTSYILVYIHPLPELLYCVSFVGGLGGALLWIAQGPELVLNSTERTMNRNSAIFWVLYMSGSLGGDTYVFLAWKGKEEISQAEQTTLALAMATVTFIGAVLIFAIRRIDGGGNEEEEEKEEQPTPREMIRSAWDMLKRRELLLMIPTMAFSGFELGFWQSIYPTCIGATKALGSDSDRLTGLTSICIGIGEILSAGVLFWKHQDDKRGYFISMVYFAGFLAFLLPSLRNMVTLVI